MLKGLFSAMFGSSSGQADNVHVIPATQIRQWMEAGQVVLVDVREPNEFAAERIPGSVNLPLSTFDPAALPAVPEGKKLVLHCRSGSRCGMAAARMVAAGHTGEINRLEGGLFGWKAAGGPTQPG